MKKVDPPTLEDITMFYRDVFRRSKLETDCIIMSLIYVERLIRRTDGRLRPRSTNWRSVLFSCMILASKVWDDLSMWVSINMGNYVTRVYLVTLLVHSPPRFSVFFFSSRTPILVKHALLVLNFLCSGSTN